jgi:hypothetical protein
MLGHANLSQASTYLHASEMNLQESMRRFEAPRGKPVVMAGVEALGSNGSIGAKQSLVDRLAQWSAEYQGRDTELAAMQSSRSATPAVIERGIVDALFGNAQFSITIKDAENVRRLCVTDGCRALVDGEIKTRRSISLCANAATL